MDTHIVPRLLPAMDALAFDRGTVRKYDQDGRLHVEITNISKANVCEYLGSEIADFAALGLDPDKKYKLFRDPEELKKAAPTFNNVPLLDKHVPVHAQSPQKQLVIGSTGTDAVFDAPYLKNSLVIWDQNAIDDIESEERVELSCAYHYVPDMTPGVFEGEKYDGVMREIRGNHVALVPEGRAGPDVIVGDSQLKPGEQRMAKQVAFSRKATLAKGALLAALPSMLAADAKPTFFTDLNKVLVGVASDNWKKEGKAKILAAFKPKLAKDASPDMLANLLDSLDNGEDPEAMDTEGQTPVDQEATNASEEQFEGKEAEDEDDPEAMGEVKAKMTPGEKTATDDDLPGMLSALSPEHCAIVKAVMTALQGGGAAKDEPPPGLTPFPKKDGKDPNADKSGEAMKQATVSKPAMDAAIAKAVEAATAKLRADMRGVVEAEEFVRPLVGKLNMAADSADQVYKAALETLGINVENIHPSAYRTILEMRPRSNTGGERPALRLASDSSMKEVAAEFPDLGRIRSV